MNDELIEAITDKMEMTFLISDRGHARHMARAALTALKAEGWMLCKWERDPLEDKAGKEITYGGDAFAMIEGKAFKLTGLEPPKGE